MNRFFDLKPLRMKHFLLASLALILFAGPALSQRDTAPAESDRMKALRIAYMTEELALTPDESKAFWPLHDAFDAKVQEERAAMKALKDSFDATKATEAELKALLDQTNTRRLALMELESAHLLEVASVLGVERALKLTELKKDLARRIRGQMGKPSPADQRREAPRRGPRR